MGATRRRRLSPIVDCVDEAAATYPRCVVQLDRPLDIAPDAGLSLTYSAIADLSRRLAISMYSEGIQPGDVVAIIKSNHIDIYIIAAAVMRLGAVPALISATLDTRTTRTLLETLPKPWIVCDQDTARQVLGKIELNVVGKRALCIGGSVPEMRPLVFGRGDAPDETRRDNDSPVLITHTSGTTGVPKLAVQSNRTIAANVIATTGWFRRMRVRETVGFYLSYAHIRFITGFTGALRMGWPLLALTNPSPGNADAFFSEYRPGVLETFPNVFILWRRLASSSSGPFHNVRWFMNTFDAMHPPAREEMLAASRRRGAIYLQVYGQTETGPVTVRIYPRTTTRHAHPRCVGYPILGFSRVKVAHRQQMLAGDILAQSKSLILGYLGRQEEYEHNRIGRWWRMTDVGERSRLGCLHLLDREIDETKDFASLLELEDRLLSEIPTLREVALIPMKEGPPIPLVCSLDGCDFDESAWAAATATLPPLQAPIHCKWEDLPQTSTWKVRRREARDLLTRGSFLRNIAPNP